MKWHIMVINWKNFQKSLDFTPGEEAMIKLEESLTRAVVR